MPASANSQPIDSLRKRSLFKLLSNIAGIPLFFLMEALFPRLLGPVQYGNYSFACSFFTQCTNFLDMGSPNFLVTRLAQTPNDFSLLAFYGRFTLLLITLMGIIAAFLIFAPAKQVIMPAIPWWVILSAALWATLMWVSRVLRMTNDALGVTAHGELGRTIVNLTSAALLLLFYFSGLLAAPGLISQQIITCAALSGAFLFVMRNQWQKPSWHLPKQTRTTIKKDFTAYCTPLVALTLCTAFAFIAERWLLQYFDGSVQQGYFSLGQKAAMGIFLFVSAITSLLQRELAVAHSQKNTPRLAQLINELGTFVYAVACWLACFAAVEGTALVRIFGGKGYEAALLALQVMTFYTIHQTYGQITGSVFYALGHTKLLRNITIISLIIGLISAWLFLAPQHLGGLHLGASGLALKMVGVQFIAVNISIFCCWRLIPFNLPRLLLHQFFCPLTFGLLAYGALLLTTTLGNAPADSFWRFIVSGIIYGLLTLLAVWLCPFVLGQTKTGLQQRMYPFWARLRKKRT